MKYSFLFLLLILFACGSEEVQEKPDYQPEIDRIEAGLMPQLIIEGDSMGDFSLPARMRFHQVSGFSVAIFENGEIKWAKGYGHLSFDSVAVVDTNTRFQAASISKPVAATGLLTLVQKGELDLDENVNEYMTDWQVQENNYTESEKVTLRRLVTHNAGLTVHGFRGYASDEDVPTTVQVLNGDGPSNSDPIIPDTIPGSIWRYSGGGYTVMQHVLEEHTAGSFPEFMEKAVLNPLDMNRSTYEQPLPEDKQDNVAIGHRGNGDKVAGNWHSYPEIAAAGLWTTPTDLAKWAMAIQKAYNGETGGVLTPEMTKEMLKPHINNWGLGPGTSGEGDSLYFSHGGANEGFRCYFLAFASTGGPGVAIMTNGDRGSVLGNEVLRSVSKEYGWNMFESVVKTPISQSLEEREAYSGEYTDGGDLNVEFSTTEKGIKGLLNGERELFFLPEGSDRYFDVGDGTILVFARDSDNKVTGFEVDGLTFTRIGD